MNYRVRLGYLCWAMTFTLLAANLAVCQTTVPGNSLPTRLTLKDAEAMALRNHPRVQAAGFGAQAARQVIREEQSAYYPDARANITGAGALPNSRIAAGALNNPLILNRQSNGLEIHQLITDFGRTSNLVGSARAEAKAASAGADQTQQDVLLGVNRAYFSVLRAQGVLNVAQETVKARQLVTDQVTTLERNKLKSMLDVSFASVNLAQAQLLLVQAQNDRKAADAELAEALGLAEPQSFNLEEQPLPTAPPPDPSEFLRQAFEKRPDLAQARFTFDAANHFAKAERDLYLPTVSAAAAAGLTPAYAAPLTDHYAAAGINVSVPIFNGFLFSARHQEAALRARADKEQVRDLSERISRDVRTAWLNANTAYQRLGVTAQLLKQSGLALDLARGRYKLGLSSIVELSQAELNLTEAQLADTNAKYDFEIQSAALAYQTGQLQ